MHERLRGKDADVNGQKGVGPRRRTWRKASDQEANGWHATITDDNVVRRGWRQ
jgi:hypothetical protein